MIMATEKRIMDALAATVKGIAAGKVKPTGRKPRPIDVVLRQAIKADGRTHYAIGQAAGVAPMREDEIAAEINAARAERRARQPSSISKGSDADRS